MMMKKFVLDFLHKHHILLVHGGGFSWQITSVLFIYRRWRLKTTADKMREFLSTYKQNKELPKIAS